MSTTTKTKTPLDDLQSSAVIRQFDVQRCRQLLGTDAEGLSDSEVELLRDQLYGLAILIIDDYLKRRESGDMSKESPWEKPVDDAKLQTYVSADYKEGK